MARAGWFVLALAVVLGSVVLGVHGVMLAGYSLLSGDWVRCLGGALVMVLASLGCVFGVRLFEAGTEAVEAVRRAHSCSRRGASDGFGVVLAVGLVALALSVLASRGGLPALGALLLSVSVWCFGYLVGTSRAVERNSCAGCEVRQ
jgi:hypothetical protein